MISFIWDYKTKSNKENKQINSETTDNRRMIARREGGWRDNEDSEECQMYGDIKCHHTDTRLGGEHTV